MPVPITDRKLREERQARHDNRVRRKRKHGAEGTQIADEPMDPNDDYGVLDWPTFINDYDVCITTYTILQQDLTVAFAPIKRPRREIAAEKYREDDRPRSPLVLVEWNRVIMDEVQMAGGSKTEYVSFLPRTKLVIDFISSSSRRMVSLIPRISSFAVSGTPARNSVDELKHVLK